MLVAGFIGFTLVGPIAGVSLFNDNTALLFGWNLGGVLVIGFVAVLLRSAESRAALHLASGPPVLIALALGFGVATLLDLIAIVVQNQVTNAPELSVIPGVFAWVLGGLFVLAVQPIAEELIFRGVLYPSLRAIQNVWATLIVSAAFYALFHQLIYPQIGGFWYTLVEPFLAGIFLGIVRAYTQSTRAAIAAHVGIGLFILSKALLIAGGVA